MKKQFKILLAVLAAVILSVCALCFAACSNNDDKDDGTTTDVSGKTYVFESGSNNPSILTPEELEEMYGGVTVTFNADGTISSEVFTGTWTQNGSTVSVDTGFGLVYSGKATGDTLTVTANSGSATLTLNFKLVKPAGSDGGDEEQKKDPFEGGNVEGYAFTFSYLEIVKMGTLTSSKIQEMTTSFYNSHFVFGANGKFIYVQEGRSAEGTWVQRGNDLTVTFFGGDQEFTVSEEAIVTVIEENEKDNNYTVKAHFTYDADYKYNDKNDDDKKEPFSGNVEGYAFKYSRLEVIKQGTLTAAQIQERETILTNSYFVFEEKGKLLAIQSGITFEGTWVQKGNVATLILGGDPQDFTVSGNEIAALLEQNDKDYNYVVKMYYAYDANYKPDDGSDKDKDDDDGGGSSTVVSGGYMNVSGCSFSYLRYKVVKMGNLTDEDFERTEERLSKSHFVFNTDGTGIVVSYNNVETFRWEQKENVIIITEDDGYSVELTIDGRDIKQVQENKENDVEVHIYYTYDPAYDYVPEVVPQPPKPVDPVDGNSVANKAYAYIACKTNSEQFAEEAEATFGGATFIFLEQNNIAVIYNGDGDVDPVGYWEQKGNEVTVGDGEEIIYIFEVYEYGITFDLSDEDGILILIFDYNPKFDFTVLNP